MNTINILRDYFDQWSGEAQHLSQCCPRALLLPTTQPLTTNSHWASGMELVQRRHCMSHYIH